MKEKKVFKPWNKSDPPKRILALRFHALGDLFISLSSIQHLRNVLPKETIIDLITLHDFIEIPSNLILFNTIYTIKGKNYKTQFLSIVPRLLEMKLKNYDVVLDLQNNKVSNLIRKIINPDCFTEFDRFSSFHACERTNNTINSANFIKSTNSFSYTFKNSLLSDQILQPFKISPLEKIILLNPAGAFTNRNWAIEKYIGLAQELLEYYNYNIKFLILGTEKIVGSAKRIEEKFPDHTINLVDKTNQIEALSLLQKADLVISEDGALLHMAYLSGKRTIGILGSTRSDWVNPKLPHTFFFTSDDLECGGCMLEKCKYETNACVARIEIKDVLNQAIRFLNS